MDWSTPCIRRCGQSLAYGTDAVCATVLSIFLIKTDLSLWPTNRLSDLFIADGYAEFREIVKSHLSPAVFSLIGHCEGLLQCRHSNVPDQGQ